MLKGWMSIYTYLETALGRVLVTTWRDAVTGFYFSDQPHTPSINSSWTRRDETGLLTEVRRQINDYAAGRREEFDLPLQAEGSEFQKRVWEFIARVPFGRTLCYGELAEQLGSPHAARAVGAAAGQNPICWIVPCHRVVGKHGALTGYAGGLARKRALLDFEASLSHGVFTRLARPSAELVGV
jgi:methylated-DNA-[protein]-cysteine S-methyltransferase